MSQIERNALSKLSFARTELATARAFLDIAETSREEHALQRNLHNAGLAITAVQRALAACELDPAHAEEIRLAADTIAGRLTRFSVR